MGNSDSGTKRNPSRRWWVIMLRDPQWWVPLIVLVGGLMVLQWIR